MPGCEEMSSCAQQDQAEQLQAQYEQIRSNILQDADEKMTAKVEEMWAKGKQMMSKEQKRQQTEQERLAGELQKCMERQNALEAENAQMKQVLAGLLGRLAQTGPMGNAAAGGLPPNSPYSAWSGSPEFYSPSPLGGLSSATTAANVLPDCPPFPIMAEKALPEDGLPSTASAPPGLTQGAASLSIAEALGPPTGTCTPKAKAKALSLAESLPATPGSEVNYIGSGVQFSFTLRKADETDLGLQVSHTQENAKALNVESISDEGAMGAWNRLCEQSHPQKKVMPGDQIISVNNVSDDVERMLEECKNKQLLRLTIARGVSSAFEPAGVAVGGSLRAEATEFVPGTISGIATGSSKSETTTPVEE